MKDDDRRARDARIKIFTNRKQSLSSLKIYCIKSALLIYCSNGVGPEKRVQANAHVS